MADERLGALDLRAGPQLLRLRRKTLEEEGPGLGYRTVAKEPDGSRRAEIGPREMLGVTGLVEQGPDVIPGAGRPQYQVDLAGHQGRGAKGPRALAGPLSEIDAHVPLAAGVDAQPGQGARVDLAQRYRPRRRRNEGPQQAGEIGCVERVAGEVPELGGGGDRVPHRRPGAGDERAGKIGQLLEVNGRKPLGQITVARVPEPAQLVAPQRAGLEVERVEALGDQHGPRPIERQPAVVVGLSGDRLTNEPERDPAAIGADQRNRGHARDLRVDPQSAAVNPRLDHEAEQRTGPARVPTIAAFGGGTEALDGAVTEQPAAATVCGLGAAVEGPARPEALAEPGHPGVETLSVPFVAADPVPDHHC